MEQQEFEFRPSRNAKQALELDSGYVSKSRITEKFIFQQLNNMRFFVIIVISLFMSNLHDSFGQIVNIDIDAKINQEMLLTDLAENVTPVFFEMHPNYKFTGIPEVVWAPPYYFLRVDTWSDFKFVRSYILQYTDSGRFVREISNSGIAITVDTVNHILYFRSNDSAQSLIAYNYDGKLISKNNSFPAFLYYIHENYIWTQYCTGLSDDKKSAVNILSRFEYKSMKEEIIHQFNDPEGVIAGRYAHAPSISFSTLRNNLYISVGTDRLIYRIQGNKLSPSFKINITPNPPVSENYTIAFKGFVGSHLFINYRHDNKNKLFIYDTKTNKGVNFTDDESLKNQGVLDNLYETGHLTKLNRLNRAGYLYFIKKAGELKQMPQGVTDPSHLVVFIAKIKD